MNKSIAVLKALSQGYPVPCFIPDLNTVDGLIYA